MVVVMTMPQKRRQPEFNFSSINSYTFRTTFFIQPHEFVVENAGDLIEMEESKNREEEYKKSTETSGSFMYYFLYQGRKY